MLGQTLLYLLTLIVQLGTPHAMRPPSTFEWPRGNSSDAVPHAPGACMALHR